MNERTHPRRICKKKAVAALVAATPPNHRSLLPSYREKGKKMSSAGHFGLLVTARRQFYVFVKGGMVTRGREPYTYTTAFHLVKALTCGTSLNYRENNPFLKEASVREPSFGANETTNESAGKMPIPFRAWRALSSSSSRRRRTCPAARGTGFHICGSIYW